MLYFVQDSPYLADPRHELLYFMQHFRQVGGLGGSR